VTARELLAAYAARTLSPVEVVAAAAARIEVDATGAFWTLCLERAAEEARAAEAAWGRGEARPLEGVPFAAKDIFDTEGVRTTYGSAMFAGHVPSRDAEAVRRMRAAGAILVGKTATHEFAWGLSTINDAIGTCRNPADLERVTGGSSGGSGAALAAGLVPLALGTDTGGSIRVPCAFCGVAGLKPTWGRVSLDGVWPLARSLDHAGPMARTATDLGLLYDVLAGAAAAAAGEPLSALVVGVCPDLHRVPLAADVAAAHAATAEALAGLGARVVEVAFPEAGRILPAFRTIQLAEALHTHRAAGLYPARRDEYGDDVGGRLDMATEVTREALLDATLEREVVRAAFARLFGEVDLLLTPVSAAAPPRIADERARPALREAVLAYTTPQDLVGLPACAVPAGTDGLGLPIGMQLTAAPGAEARVLGAAAALAGAGLQRASTA
jgi:aspartyl-tRNA(Asn)/glutamyl-tRNA(Gln) amidotransferase subunit A